MSDDSDIRNAQRWADAARLAHRNGYAPRCHCGKRMYKDTFNGMWVCREQGHGGYQTERQVKALIYDELMEAEVSR